MISQANVRNIILRDDVVRAVEQREFHLFAVHSIEQGLEILTGVRAGDIGEKDTIRDRVDRRLREMAQELKQFVPTGKESPSSHRRV